MFKMEILKSVCHIIIILFFILNIIPLFNCVVKDNKETYFTCKGNKVEQITQNTRKFTISKISNTDLIKDQDVANVLLKGIQKLINSFNINSEGLYFKKSSKIMDVEFATKSFTFKAIFPENFLSLRKLYDTAQEFNESFTSSSLIIDQDYENKEYIKLFYTSDYKYVIETISKKQHDILNSILFDSFSHFCTFPNSLLPKYSGLYYIKQESIEYYFVIIRNMYTPFSIDDRMLQYYLNGSNNIAIKTNQMQIINFQLLDINFNKRFPEGLKVSLDEQKSIVKTLENDTKFLAKLNMINYNLLLVIFSNDNSHEVEKSSQTSNSNHHNKFIKFKDESNNIIVIYGIIDTLYSYNLKQKIQNSIGFISNDTVKDPSKYQKRFMEYMKSKVFTLNNKT